MAENIEPSLAKRSGKPNFMPEECAVIFQEAEENLTIIKASFLQRYRTKISHKFGKKSPL